MNTRRTTSSVIDLSVVDLKRAKERYSQNSSPDSALLARIVAAQGEILQAGLDPQKVVEVITRRTQELTRSDGAVVELLDGDEMIYWSASGSLTAHLGVRLSAAKSLSGLCAQAGCVLQSNDTENDPRVDIEQCRRAGIRSMVVAPLPYGEKIIGVLKVTSSVIGAYGPQDVKTLEHMNVLIGASLNHAIEHAMAKADLDARRHADARVTTERAAARARTLDVIEHGHFALAFQPIMDLLSGRTVGLEALTRFSRQPELAPDTWFAEAAAVGLSVQLETTTIRRALTALERIPTDAYLAVNVSPETIASRELEKILLATQANRIVLELTEHSSVADYGELFEHVLALKRLGARLAIDDAGAGFASLRHVLRLHPDLIKLDISLTRDIDSQPRHQKLISAMLTFAGGTGAALVAEGIETGAELQTLKILGVTYGQGFYLGRPHAEIATPKMPVR